MNEVFEVVRYEGVLGKKNDDKSLSLTTGQNFVLFLVNMYKPEASNDTCGL